MTNKDELIKQYKYILDIDCHLICSDKNTLSFPRESNYIFIDILKKYNLLNIDVTNKKF